MRKLTLLASIIGSIAFPLCANAVNELYIETGLGISQYGSDLSGSTLNDTSIAPSAKVLIGSRLTQSGHIWYELMYNYNSKTTYSDSNISLTSRMISNGFKLTTNQTSPLSAFVRSGFGKVSLTPSGGSSITKNQYYLGGGISYRFENSRALNVEYQHFIVPAVDTDSNSNTYQINSSAVFLTLKQDID